MKDGRIRIYPADCIGYFNKLEQEVRRVSYQTSNTQWDGCNAGVRGFGILHNSLFFGSDKMARVSAVYHTIISTSQMQGVSVLRYFKKFFGEIVKGRRDYTNLLALSIDVSNNK